MSAFVKLAASLNSLLTLAPIAQCQRLADKALLKIKLDESHLLYAKQGEKP